MAKICFLLTTTPWSDRRQFFRQAPALSQGGHEILYMSGDPGGHVTDSFGFSILSQRTRTVARITGALNIFARLLRHRPAVVQLCSVEQLPLGLALKLFTGIKVVYDCREDHPNSMLKHRERWPRVWAWMMYAVARIWENIADRWFDGVVVSDPALYRTHRGAPPSRKIIFFNTPLLRQFDGSFRPLPERDYDVALMGSMSARTGVITLIEALGLLKQRGREVTLMLLGRPDEHVIGSVNRLLDRFGIREQTTITGRIPHEQVPGVLSQARIGTVTLLDFPKFRNNIACKAFEYMACGMPVISSDLPPEREFLKEGRNALFYQPGDAEGLARAIATLLDDLPRAEAMGQAGREDVERQWNGEREQERLRRFYARILRDNGATEVDAQAAETRP